MVDDVCPLVQVVHVVAAVIATVTKHELQHQVLWEHREEGRGGGGRQGRDSQKGRRHSNADVYRQLAADTVRRYSIAASSHPHPHGRSAPRRARCFSVRNKFRLFFWGGDRLQFTCTIYLDGPLLLAHVVGLQLLRLWQRSADGGPGPDNSGLDGRLLSWRIT